MERVNQYRSLHHAAKELSVYAKGASPAAKIKRLELKFQAAVCAEVMLIYLQFYYLMFRSGYRDAIVAK
jgi:hypothetical protein